MGFDFQWVQAISALLGAFIGLVGGIFSVGRHLGRMESRLKLDLVKSLGETEKRIEDNVQQSQNAFDETLKGLRQKINDVELGSEKRFLPKEEFGDFRQEYREDMRDLKELISRNRKSEKV